MIKGKVWHYLPGDMSGEGIMKKMTNEDIVGGGSKIWQFRGDVISEWPLNKFDLITKSLDLHVNINLKLW